MTRVHFCALVLSVATITAGAAQEPPVAPPSSTPPAPVQTPLPAVAPAPVTASPEPLDEATFRRRRREIKNMEGVLSSAVRSAALEMASEMETPETGKFLMSGSRGARGFILDGHGVFFYVEIPGVQPTFISQAAIEALRQRLARPRPARPEVASSGTATSDPPNADAEYVSRVKDSLMRAMIQYSKPLELRPEEWLTVAAGDGDEPMMPAVLSEQAVMLLRVRGRDIAEYMAGRLSLGDVLKRVEARKF